ncbi:MAG: ATP-binding cassette domain-containing protein [bacterium]|nr:ATP-binding cassette domain-containing protein [bacterium]
MQHPPIETALELHDACKSFAGVVALQATSIAFEAGRTTVLIGPSGCGKSTLLRLINGLLEPDRGCVVVRGRTLSRANVGELRRRMGYVIQEGGLFPHLTARRNVTLMADYIGWPRERVNSRLSELAELTRFPADGLERYPRELSGGQRQRVSLMRALMLDPDVLLLDEPLGALDPMIRADLQDELREIFRRLSKTVVMVTHDLDEAGFFADSIALMRDGRVVQRGSLAALVERPADEFVTRFVRAQRRTRPPGDTP